TSLFRSLAPGLADMELVSAIPDGCHPSVLHDCPYSGGGTVPDAFHGIYWSAPCLGRVDRLSGAVTVWADSRTHGVLRHPGLPARRYFYRRTYDGRTAANGASCRH